MMYKVSFVIPPASEGGQQGEEDLGTILDMEKRPEKGEKVKLGNKSYEIVEVLEIVPSRGEFGYLHATCRPVEE